MKSKIVAILLAIVLIPQSCKKNKGSDLLSREVDDVFAYAGLFRIIKDYEHEKHDTLDSYFKTMCRENLFNGSILIAEKGKVIYENFSGYSRYETKDTLSVQSAFQLASVSKQFTAAAIMLLKERGLLNYSDTVQRFYPDFPYKDITIKQLLTHHAGLGNYMYFSSDSFDFSQSTDNRRLMEYIIHFKPPVYYQAGQRFDYSNTGYAILAAIVEKITQKPFEDFLNDEFFAPLQMKHTFVFDGDTKKLENRSFATCGYTFSWRKKEHTWHDGVLGDKGIYSTAQDLLRWDQALYTNKILKQETLQEAFSPLCSDLDSSRNYGYGWRINILDNGYKEVYHGGWWHGYNTLFVRLPEDNRTIIILTNKRNRALGRFHNELLSIIDSTNFFRPPVEPEGIATTRPQNSFYVVVGTRLTAAKAKKLQSRLRKLGLSASVFRRWGSKYYVYTESFASEDEAADEIMRIRKYNISSLPDASNPYIAVN